MSILKTQMFKINVPAQDKEQKIDFSASDMAQLKVAGQILAQGGLVAFPTETVYGLGGDAMNPKASEKIYAAKGRPSDNPLIVHIASLDALKVLAREIPENAMALAKAFWPGPMTMIFKKQDCVPYETTGGLDTVAVRFPSHPVAKEMILASGTYIAAPSANTSGRPSPTTAQHVFEDMDGRIDAIIDGGAGYGVWTDGYGHTLTVNGTIISNGYYAITSNGSENGNLVTDSSIIINKGAVVSVPNGIAIYHPEKGTVTINGGEISGHTGVEMCAGDLIVNGGSITSTGANMNATGSQNAIMDGAAISVINRNYPGGIPTAKINGGTIRATGNGALAVKAYDYKGDVVAEWMDASEHVEVNGGTFYGEVNDLEKYIPETSEVVSGESDGFVVRPKNTTIVIIRPTEEEKPAEDTKNPNTGANDLVGVAVALAVAALVSGAAVSMKKDNL